MGPRPVAALAVLAALLTGYFWVFEREPDRPRIGPAFPRLAFADIVEIELAAAPAPETPGAASGPVLLRKKDDGGWWIDRPEVPALIPRVESIAYSLVELQRIADVPLTEAPSTFGPRGPEETVRLRTRSGEEHRVEVGKDHPDAAFDLCYVRVDGQSLFLTRKSFKKNLQSRLDDLRSRALFPIPKDRVAKLEVSGSGATGKALHREKADDFRFDLPAPAPANRDRIARALDDLNSWRAESFVRDEPGDLAPFGLDRPRATIAITDRDGVRTAVDVGAAAPAQGQAYVRWADRPFVMTASLSIVEGLERPAEEFYSEFVLQLGAEEITEVSVRGAVAGGRDYALRRVEEKEPARASPSGKKGPSPGAASARWEVAEAGGTSTYPADHDRIAVLSSGLKYLSVKRYIPRPPVTPDPAGAPPKDGVVAEVRTDTAGRYPLVFTPPAPGEDPTPGLRDVVSGDEPFVFRVITRIPDDLARGGAWFRDRHISRLDVQGLREFEVTLREDSGERTWTLGRPGEEWSLAQSGDPSGREAKFDERLAKKVASLLSREDFQVDEWAPPETDLAAREIDDSRFQVRITLTGVSPDHRGFTRLYIGQGNVEGGATVSYWGRVNEPGLERLPFLLERSRARAVLDLVDHLKEIGGPESR